MAIVTGANESTEPKPKDEPEKIPVNIYEGGAVALPEIKPPELPTTKLPTPGELELAEATGAPPVPPPFKPEPPESETAEPEPPEPEVPRKVVSPTPPDLELAEATGAPPVAPPSKQEPPTPVPSPTLGQSVVQYTDKIKVNETGQIVSTYGNDSVVYDLIKNNAPPDLILDYLNAFSDTIKYPGVYENIKDYFEKLAGEGKITVVSDVDAFNKKFGLNISPDFPYLTPGQEAYVNAVVRSEGSVRVLQQQGFIVNGQIKPEAFERAQSNKTIKKALIALGYTEADIKNIAEAVKQGRTADAFRLYGQAYIEQTVLVGLPENLRDAYLLGMRTGDYSKYNTLVAKYQAEFDKWFSENILSDKYFTAVYKSKGTQAAVDAYNKRQSDLAGISERIITSLTRSGHATARGQYPEGGAPFELYESGELGIDVVSAVKGGFDRRPLVYLFGEVEVFNAERIAPYTDKAGNIDIAGYIWDNKDVQPLKYYGVTDEDIKQSEKYNAYKYPAGVWVDKQMQDDGQDTWTDLAIRADVTSPDYDPAKEPTVAEWEKLRENIKEKHDELYTLAPEKKPSAIAKEIGLSMIPVYGTYRYYQQVKENGLTGGEIAMLAGSAIADMLFIIPGIGLISAGARGTFTAGRVGGLYGATLAARDVAIAEIKAPFTVLAHPIQTIKAAGGSIETVFRRLKVPLSSWESYFSTTRVPIKAVGTAQDTKRLQDAVTTAMTEGRSSTAMIAGAKVELRPTALNKLGTPVAVHATPDVRPFMDGIELTDDLYVAPRGSTRFSLADSSGLVPDGGMKGAIIIRDPKVVSALQSSGKLYKRTAEVERVLPRGYKLDSPVQTLISRTPSGDKLTLLVFGKKFSNLELAKMKFIGSLDTVKQIFTKDIKFSRADKLFDEAADLASEIKDAQKALKLARTAKAKAVIRQRIVNLEKQVDNQYRAAIDAYGKMRVTPSVMLINTQDYGPLDKWRIATGGKRTTGSADPQRLEPIEVRERADVSDRARRDIPVSSPSRRVTSIAANDRRLPSIPSRRVAPSLVARSAPGLPERRTTPQPLERRVPQSPADRRVPPSVPRRGFVTPPRRAVITPADRRIPVPPERRLPPEPPEIRIPPPPPRMRRTPPVAKPPVTPEIAKLSKREEKKRHILENPPRKTITWKQGIWWWTIKPPYKSIDDVVKSKRPPTGAEVVRGPGSAYKTIQSLGGNANVVINIDYGNQDITIRNPRKRAGALGAIKFKRDPKNKRTGDIDISQIGGVR